MLSYCYHIIPRIGLCASGWAVVALDTVFLCGKLLPKNVPAVVTQGALFGLSCTSIIGFPYQVSLLKKTVQDMLHSYASWEKAVLVATALKSLYVAGGILLSTGNLVGATAGLLGEHEFQSALYSIMIPYGEASIGIGIILMASYVYFFHQTLKNPLMIVRALPLLSRNALSNEPLEQLRQLASEIRHCMDKDTLSDLIEKFSAERDVDFGIEVRKNIETQQNMALRGGIAISLIGYILMAVEKYYTPNSIQAAIINETMALFYTLNESVRLGLEVCQRNAIEAIELPITPK